MGSTGKGKAGPAGFMSGSSGVGPIASGTGTTPNSNPLQPNVTITPANQGNPNVQNQTPNAQNTPVKPGAATQLTQMSDDELAALVIASKKAQMPNHLADYPSPTQKFVFQAGINEMPMVLNQSEFQQYMQDNNIDSSKIMGRTVSNASYTNQQGYQVNYTAEQINNMLKHSRLNYIGGKQGRNCYGEGAYFDVNGGGNTGYGRYGTTQDTISAVLNPKTAKVINYNSAFSKARSFAQSHPKFARAVGNITDQTISIYALAMGYNVISDGGSYRCVIDRSALVIRE